MTDEERLHAALSTMVAGARPPSGAAVRAAVPRRARWFRAGAAVGAAATAGLAVVAVAAALTREPTPARPADSADVARYVWNDATFEYPAAWSTLMIDVQSRGPVGFGPYISNGRFRDACLKPASGACGRVVDRLEPGQVLAQWVVIRRSPAIGVTPPAEATERRGDGRTMSTYVGPVDSDCAAVGGTLSIDYSIDDEATMRSRVLRACFNDDPAAPTRDHVRAIAVSLTWPVSD
ncbi:MAG TPA: hypothetical protein VF519_10930 [Mycobacteriales bacterium]|jgi:hypothetical protein